MFYNCTETIVDKMCFAEGQGIGSPAEPAQIDRREEPRGGGIGLFKPPVVFTGRVVGHRQKAVRKIHRILINTIISVK